MAAGRPAAFACRQGDPAAAPLNSRGRATMPPGPLASVTVGKLPWRMGESGSAHSQHDAKVAEVAVTTVRTAGRGGLPRKRPVQIICPLRPPASRRQIFLPAPT